MTNPSASQGTSVPAGGLCYRGMSQEGAAGQKGISTKPKLPPEQPPTLRMYFPVPARGIGCVCTARAQGSRLSASRNSSRHLCVPCQEGQPWGRRGSHPSPSERTPGRFGVHELAAAGSRKVTCSEETFTGDIPNQPPWNVVLNMWVLAPSCASKSPWDVTSQCHGTSLCSQVPKQNAGWAVIDVPPSPPWVDLLHLAGSSHQLRVYQRCQETAQAVSITGCVSSNTGCVSSVSCHPAPLVTPCHPPTLLTPQPFAAILACRILQGSGNYQRQLPASPVITTLNGTRNMLII